MTSFQIVTTSIFQINNVCCFCQVSYLLFLIICIMAESPSEQGLAPPKPRHRRSTSRSSQLTQECTSCLDESLEKSSYHLPCNHWYCLECFRALVTTAMENESQYPPKCCLTAIPPATIIKALSRRGRHQYKLKAAEWTTLPTERRYCPSPNCGKWLAPLVQRRSTTTNPPNDSNPASPLGLPSVPAANPHELSTAIELPEPASLSRHDIAEGSLSRRMKQWAGRHLRATSEDYLSCPYCHTRICPICHAAAHHRDTDCPQDQAVLQIRQTAQELLWAECYSCHMYVEHNKGCRHMRCRCHAEFCYVYGARWKTCLCTERDMTERITNMRIAQASRDDRQRTQERQFAVQQAEIDDAIAQIEAIEAREAVAEVERFERAEARRQAEREPTQRRSFQDMLRDQ